MTTTKKSVIAALHAAIQAKHSCVESEKSEVADAWADYIDEIQKNCLPSGSGFDSGTRVDTRPAKSVRFICDFHHMDDLGYYDGWTNHSVTASPRFGDSIDIRVTGSNRNGIKDYIVDTFHYMLTAELPDHIKFEMPAMSEFGSTSDEFIADCNNPDKPYNSRPGFNNQYNSRPGFNNQYVLA